MSTPTDYLGAPVDRYISSADRVLSLNLSSILRRDELTTSQTSPSRFCSHYGRGIKFSFVVVVHRLALISHVFLLTEAERKRARPGR